MDSVVTLIGETFTQNSIGEQIPVELTRQVYCRIQSVSGEEWDRAARNDRQAVFRIVMPAINYEDERVLVYAGARYSIYRVYRPADGDEIELYVEQKAGVE